MQLEVALSSQSLELLPREWQVIGLWGKILNFSSFIVSNFSLVDSQHLYQFWAKHSVVD